MNLSVLAADDPVTCATYAKENYLLHIDGWKRFRNLVRRDKITTRAVMQFKIMQARRSNKYMFDDLIPKSCKEALQFDKENSNTKWADALGMRWIASMNRKSSPHDKELNGIQTTNKS